ncbi:hypothetical protein [Calothrix sp. NIES-3974]|uniref:hypothetical protein n=1 Tax=Calothrix sp. NIES-3974 TaxID=2005462 RepID=UPI000B5F0161|nr:hypothetical protein [Calothrix sp. NIES-3974]BAZ05329.1 hypothetical protein NIES3974_19760 [Calothrix sp. NIES-3974]
MECLTFGKNAAAYIKYIRSSFLGGQILSGLYGHPYQYQRFCLSARFSQTEFMFTLFPVFLARPSTGAFYHYLEVHFNYHSTLDHD